MRKFLIAAAVALFAAANAQAGFQVTFAVNAATVTVVDGGPGDNDGVANGSIVVINQMVAGVAFNVTLTTTNTPGTDAIAFVNHSTSSITSTAPLAVGTTVSVLASANGFTKPVGNGTAISGSTFQFQAPTASGNAATHTYNAYYDATNALSTTIPAGTLIGTGTQAGVLSPAGNTNLNDVRSVTTAGTFALNLYLAATVTTSNGAQALDLDGTVQISAVPAPAGLVLALAGMPVLGLGAFVRRRVAKA